MRNANKQVAAQSRGSSGAMVESQLFLIRSDRKEAGQAGAVRESTAPDIGDAGWNRDNG